MHIHPNLQEFVCCLQRQLHVVYFFLFVKLDARALVTENVERRKMAKNKRARLAVWWLASTRKALEHLRAHDFWFGFIDVWAGLLEHAQRSVIIALDNTFYLGVVTAFGRVIYCNRRFYFICFSLVVWFFGGVCLVWWCQHFFLSSFKVSLQLTKHLFKRKTFNCSNFSNFSTPAAHLSSISSKLMTLARWQKSD